MSELQSKEYAFNIGDVVQITDQSSPYAGRLGKVDDVYWTNSRSGGKEPRWLVKVRFRRGHFPHCCPRNFALNQVERLTD